MKAKLIIQIAATAILSPFVILAQQVPTPDHVVIVVLENHGYTQVIGAVDAPYINSLANDPYGALFTQSHGVTHPSQPNYLYLFSGSSQNVILDFTPFSFLLPFTTANLGASLLQHGRTFIGYSEDLPSVGFTGDTYASYARKHNPWVNWQDGNTNGIPSSLNQPLTSFPSNYSSLPTLCFVIPNLDNDMHNGSIATSDAWLQSRLDSYVQWAKTNNSLLIITFDEDDGLQNNRMATIFIGQMVKAGQYSEDIDHNDVLRTLEAMYGLSYAGSSSSATTITDCWVYKTVSAMSANPLNICPGQSVNLTDMTANEPTAWSWAFPGGVPDVSSDKNPVVNYSSPGAYDVTLVTSNHMGYDTLFKPGYINVQANISLALSDDSLSICKGDTATVTVSGASAYNWLPANNIISANGNAMSAAPDVNAVYWVTASGNTCPSDTVAFAVTVNPLPFVTVSSDTQSICEGSSATFTAFGANNFTWSPSAGLNTTAGATVTASPVSTTTYIANGSDNNGCAADVALQVFVNPLPVVTVSPPSPGVCEGSSVTLTAQGADSFNWSPSAELNTTVGATVTATPASSASYTITGIDANNCLATTTVSVLVNPLPVVTASPASPGVCEGGSVTLTAEGADSFNWSPSTELNTTVGATVIATPSSNASYIVTGTDANNCSAETTVSVLINPLPVVTVLPASPGVCEGGSVTLTAEGADSFNWSPSTELNTTVGATVIATPSSNASYIVTGTDANNCSAETTVSVLINPLPVVTVLPASPGVCEGSSVTLSAQGATDFSWSPSSGLDTAAGATVIATLSSNTTFTITGTDNNGCSSVTNLDVVVNPLPNPFITAVDSALSSTIADSYQWYLNGQLVQDATSQDYIAVASGDYKVEVFSNGCSDFSNTITVTLSTTGINNLHPHSLITIYPNPSNGQFVISGTMKGEFSMELHDVTGRLVFQAMFDVNDSGQIIPVNIAQLEKGIYLLTLTLENQKQTEKVLVY